MTISEMYKQTTGKEAIVQDNDYTAGSVNAPRENLERKLTKDTKLRLSQVTDTTYKVGEISRKTGLQKQPDGSWAPPKGAQKAPAKKDEGRSAEERQAWASMNGFKNEEEMKKAEKEALEFERKFKAGEIDAEGNPKQPAASSEAKPAKEKSWKPDYDPYSGVNSLHTESGLDVYFAPKSKEDMSGWTISIEGDPVAWTGETWENASEEQIASDLEDLEAELKDRGEKDVDEIMEHIKSVVYKDSKNNEPVTQPGEHGTREQVVAVRKDSISPKKLEDELSRNFYNAANPGDLESDLASLGYSLEEMNNEYAVISNNKGSQFQVKFSDHGDGRDFTIESMNLVYQDEDDDTDYDTEDAAPTIASIFESIKK